METGAGFVEETEEMVDVDKAPGDFGPSFWRKSRVHDVLSISYVSCEPAEYARIWLNDGDRFLSCVTTWPDQS